MYRNIRSLTALTVVTLTVHGVLAQQSTPTARPPFTVGNPLGLPIAPAADGVFHPMSTNVKGFR